MNFIEWSNEETRCIAEWVAEDVDRARLLREQARESLKAARVAPIVLDCGIRVELAAMSELADRICEHVWKEVPKHRPNVVTCLLDVALGQVNWDELAIYYLSDVSELIETVRF